ncbi:MAG: hypothetical protein IBX55_20530 [Methyloprofundus sp.]|nr:hypothetical protein [Methyloprofundus sp.]
MLIYHQAQDINHCVYRLLLILESSSHEQFDIEVYRLVDFYTLFPHLLKDIKPVPKALNKLRTTLSDVEVPFESLKNTKRILYELESLQSIAIQNLLAKSLLDKSAFEIGKLKRTDKSLPDVLTEEMKSSRLAVQEWFNVLINGFPNAAFLGNSGLKARTGMMEYRYDLERK